MNNDAFIVQIISIHAPAKGATYFDYLKVSVRIFQSTLPRRERRASYETRTSGRCYFNPRSREGSDSSANSIINRQTLFQSTLPRRERHPAPLPSHPLQHFNPRSREGSDQRPQQAAAQGAEISIHAPAKGATSRIMSIASTVSIFQSTLPRRERRGRSAHCGTSSTFQSTLPRRERRSAGLAPAFSSMHFNPRSREGSDVAGRPIAASEPFQSTLPRRERRASSAVMGKAAAFQSTLPRRERPDR